jgi:hypothetical protein
LLLLQAHYPELLKDVRIRVIELMDYVLSTYDRKIGEYTNKQFERAGGHDAVTCYCRALSTSNGNFPLYDAATSTLILKT